MYIVGILKLSIVNYPPTPSSVKSSRDTKIALSVCPSVCPFICLSELKKAPFSVTRFNPIHVFFHLECLFTPLCVILNTIMHPSIHLSVKLSPPKSLYGYQLNLAIKLPKRQHCQMWPHPMWS